MLEQLSGDLLLTKVGGNVEGSHAYFGTGLFEANIAFSECVKDLGVSTLRIQGSILGKALRASHLGGKVDWGEAVYVLICRAHLVHG